MSGEAAIRAVGAALAAGTFASLVFRVLQDRVLFRPGRDGLRADAVGIDGLHEVAVRATDGAPTYAWIRDPAPGRPVLMYLHGNRGTHPDRKARMRLLARGDWGLCFPEYRGYGRNGGRPGEAGFLADVEGALRLLGDRGVPPRRVVLYGKSLGSAVAVALAARHPVAALVLDSPFTRLADVAAHHLPMLPVRRLLRHRFDAAAVIERVGAPLLVLQGARDRVVPPRLGRRLFDRATGPKRLAVLPDGAHEGLLLGAGFDVLNDFLASHGLLDPAPEGAGGVNAPSPPPVRPGAARAPRSPRRGGEARP